jgi:hypothetical protein
VRLFLETAPVPKGATDSRPFSVVATADDGREIEAAGTLELSSHADPITTARVYVQPEHLAVKGRKGKYAVDVDNRQGGEPLEVRLSGSDEFGRARISFQPPALTVPAGQVARAIAVIEHPRPEGGSSSTRQVQVLATSLTGSVSGRAAFTQQADSYRKLWAVLLVLLGAMLVAFAGAKWATDPPVDGVRGPVERLFDNSTQGTAPASTDIVAVTVTVMTAMVLFCVATMLLGLVGTGRLVRVSAVFAALWSAGVVLADPFTRLISFDPGQRPVSSLIALALPGAVLAFAGGVLLKP